MPEHRDVQNTELLGRGNREGRREIAVRKEKHLREYNGFALLIQNVTIRRW
jgi:hypothetical protein